LFRWAHTEQLRSPRRRLVDLLAPIARPLQRVRDCLPRRRGFALKHVEFSQYLVHFVDLPPVAGPRHRRDAYRIIDHGADRGREAAHGARGGGYARLLALCLAPNRREPRLPLSWQTGRPVVMMQLDETRRNHVVAPCVEVEEAGVAAVAKAFFVVPPWI
jgi:hypothetical protein